MKKNKSMDKTMKKVDTIDPAQLRREAEQELGRTGEITHQESQTSQAA
ncbi:MAG: hypothetical protein ABII02_04705 [Candidatus Magasanikbacteria bacterium]